MISFFLAALAALGLPLLVFCILTVQDSKPYKPNWNLAKLMGVRKHDLSNKKTTTITNTKTMAMKMTKTFREHLQRAIFETFDIWDIWSEWWENRTWPTKRQLRRQRQWKRHLENTFKEGSLRLLTFVTFDHSDEKTWPDQQKDNDDDEYI